jgi:hypothetical protein
MRVGTLCGTQMANRVLRVLSFFTIQSNILSGVTSAQLARNPARDGRAWRAVRLAALFGITVTGIVYSTVLAKTHEPHGWQETSTNNVFHYIVPIMMVLGWLLFGPRRRIERRTVGLAILWPVAWIGYILILRRDKQVVSVSVPRRHHARLRPGHRERAGARGRAGGGAVLARPSTTTRDGQRPCRRSDRIA